MQQTRERAVALFEYVKQLCMLKRTLVMDVRKQPHAVWLKDLPLESEDVELFSRDTAASDEGADAVTEDTLLLRIRKPELPRCPELPEDLRAWFDGPWDDHTQAVTLREAIERTETVAVPAEEAPEEPDQEADIILPDGSDGSLMLMRHVEAAPKEPTANSDDEPKTQIVTVLEKLEDDADRARRCNEQLVLRSAWCAEMAKRVRVRSLFATLYEMDNDLRKDPDKYDLMLGNGLLIDRMHPEYYHPIFLKRLNIGLKPYQNAIELRDSSVLPELNMMLLSTMENINSDLLLADQRNAREEDIHPLDHHAAGVLLRTIAHKLSHSAQYVPENSESDDSDARYLIRWEPVIYLSRHLDGSAEMTDHVMAALEASDEVPGSLVDILGGTEEENSVSEHVGMTDALVTSTAYIEEEILLPKPANAEQIAIAKRIQRSNAVLVQGPPGTGKTHTIANLLGNFLSQGKSVLVTSQTNKALSVLKEKVPEAVQDLCVTMLSDGGSDMEKSVNAIVDHISSNDTTKTARKVEKARAARIAVEEQLAEARQLVNTIRYQEFAPISFDGRTWSPAEMAKFLADHAETMMQVPGPVQPETLFPMSMEDLQALYATNAQITADEENELRQDLPDPERLPSFDMLSRGMLVREASMERIQRAGEQLDKKLLWQKQSDMLIDLDTGKPLVHHVSRPDAESLLAMLQSLPDETSDWFVRMVADCAAGGSRQTRWLTLRDAINETYAASEALAEKMIGRVFELQSGLSNAELKEIYKELLTKLDRKGEISGTALFMQRKRQRALEQVTIDRTHPRKEADLRLVMEHLELMEARDRLGILWNQMPATCGEPAFDRLGAEPERNCRRIGQEITKWSSWLALEYPNLPERLSKAGLAAELQDKWQKPMPEEESAVRAVFQEMRSGLLPVVQVAQAVANLVQFENIQEELHAFLDKEGKAPICQALADAIRNEDGETYALHLAHLNALVQKRPVLTRREELLEKLRVDAPHWADAIRDRDGIHAKDEPPANPERAWTLRQMEGILDKIASTSLRDALAEVAKLTAEYGRKTAELAAAMAWHALRVRIEEQPSMQGALIGWKQTMRQIGKGQGRYAAKHRKKAQELMVQCQRAVPAWIMPISQVVDTLDPQKTRFDVVIIDEASQADVTAMVLMYMGKKIIIVGDDEQVSPMAIGTKMERVYELQATYLKDKIPNAHLYTPTDSLYDIAARSYKAMMLREHFRCVPDIIRYCNHLCYDGKIKPLREAGSSPVSPAVVPYHVPGRRVDKTNRLEAETIISLMMACMEQPEYDGMTFGVISMLGDDQVKLIDRMLYEKFDLTVREQRQILCGNASNFQGDERDVIFLSMVDSNEQDGPLPLSSDRKETRQRYNVAVSRARDQLFIVHSLDYTRDLKQGDMRRGLLEYAADPQARETLLDEAEQHAESPFEMEVAQALILRGYHIEQQHKVGAYRLDMIAICGNRRVAIECDGERWHSSAEQVARDMERQDVLERLGWTFIRIRGSEYFRRKDATIERVVAELTECGIQPETAEKKEDGLFDEPPLLRYVKQRAQQIRQEWKAGKAKPAPEPEAPDAREAPATEPAPEDAASSAPLQTQPLLENE